jgi:hypothetical protein
LALGDLRQGHKQGVAQVAPIWQLLKAVQLALLLPAEQFAAHVSAAPPSKVV